ncbi:MAG: permease [Syntrophomonadaceae bacterium]|nr:permease [Syntrophomonadaceae bacterium]
MTEQLNNLQIALKFFLQISLELVILFIGITFLVSLILQYVSPERVQKALSGRRLGFGNIIGAVFGGVTPFCSCSAVPMMMGLLELGVPFGVAMSFLIASPLGVFNPVVLSLFGALLGPGVLLLYMAATFVAAVAAGIALDALGLGKYVKEVRIIGASQTPDGTNLPAAGRELFKARMRIAAAGAVGLFRQMVPFLLVGVAIGSLIYGYIPTSFLSRIAGPDNPFAIPVAAAVGVPMYVRTETMIPIGFAMIKKGVSVGAIMSLTIGGAGASIPELTMLAGIFKRRLWIAYVITIFTVATLIGFMFNFLVQV